MRLSSITESLKFSYSLRFPSNVLLLLRSVCRHHPKIANLINHIGEFLCHRLHWPPRLFLYSIQLLNDLLSFFAGIIDGVGCGVSRLLRIENSWLRFGCQSAARRVMAEWQWLTSKCWHDCYFVAAFQYKIQFCLTTSRAKGIYWHQKQSKVDFLTFIYPSMHRSAGSDWAVGIAYAARLCMNRTVSNQSTLSLQFFGGCTSVSYLDCLLDLPYGNLHVNSMG